MAVQGNVMTLLGAGEFHVVPVQVRGEHLSIDDIHFTVAVNVGDPGLADGELVTNQPGHCFGVLLGDGSVAIDVSAGAAAFAHLTDVIFDALAGIARGPRVVTDVCIDGCAIGKVRNFTFSACGAGAIPVVETPIVERSDFCLADCIIAASERILADEARFGWNVACVGANTAVLTRLALAWRGDFACITEIAFGAFAAISR